MVYYTANKQKGTPISVHCMGNIFHHLFSMFVVVHHVCILLQLLGMDYTFLMVLFFVGKGSEMMS